MFLVNEEPIRADPEHEDGRRTRHQHRRPELVNALATYFLEHGLSDHSLRPVAAAIGVSHSTLLRHFSSKEELIVEVVQKITSDFVAKMLADMEAHLQDTIGDFLRALWMSMNEPFERNHFLFLFEISAREGRNEQPQFNVGRMLTEDLMDPIRDKLMHDFSMRLDEAAVLAHLSAAQIRGLMIDLALGGNPADAEALMDQFIALAAPVT